MRYVLVAGADGRDLFSLEKRLMSFDPHVLVCAGDLAAPAPVLQLYRLAERYAREGREVIAVPGDRDVAALSATDSRDRDAFVQHISFSQHQQAAWYLAQLVSSGMHARKRRLRDVLARQRNHRLPYAEEFFLDQEQYGGAYPTVVIHGGFDGFSFEEPRGVTYRLRNAADHARNFAAMRQRGAVVMIRGHDRVPSYACEQGGVSLHGSDDTYLLGRRARHTITPGALRDGHVALIDTESYYAAPALSFHRV